MNTMTRTSPAVAHVSGPASTAVPELLATLNDSLGTRTASVVMFFASADYKPSDLAGPLTRAFPQASVLGCSSSGEFTSEVSGTNAISAIAFPDETLIRHAAALGELDVDPATGTRQLLDELSDILESPLRNLDDGSWLGFVLIDGMHGAEEIVNEQLGNAAPLLHVVGGSAGDDLAFEKTWVSVGEKVSWNGVALVIAQSAVPFTVVKTCSFIPAGRKLTITRADVADRTVWEFDGRPAVQVYAEALGIPVEAVDSSAFMAHPVGLMDAGRPFIRSPQQIIDGTGLRFYCQILEGMQVELMNPGDLIGDTARAINDAREEVGGNASGAVYFNCILRRLELDTEGLTDAFIDALGGIPAAGFHTYGESWIGHINQTLTGVVFG